MSILHDSMMKRFEIRPSKNMRNTRRKSKKKQAHQSRDKVMPKDAERARLHIWFVPAENRIREETN